MVAALLLMIMGHIQEVGEIEVSVHYRKEMSNCFASLFLL